jgi:hypothetical protein
LEANAKDEEEKAAVLFKEEENMPVPKKKTNR